MIKIKVRTRFDITATGITGQFKHSQIPFTDQSGNTIIDTASWNRARNQQRNWETLTQLIQLRTQIINLSNPVKNENVWEFEFATETEVFNNGADPVGVLKTDSDGVPMLQKLDNDPGLDAVLVTHGPKQNIWFISETINTILENTDG
jgi:hypothetical protein